MGRGKHTVKRAYSVHELMNMKHNMIQIQEPQWAALLGENIELAGSWIIWGNSANGKTSFALKLAKALAQYKKIAYNSLEQGNSFTLISAMERENMLEVNKKLTVLNREPISELVQRLKLPKSPDIIFIDSVQHAELTYAGYKKLKGQFPNKLFILISHADGMHPAGRSAKSMRYDADIKIRVEGFIATSSSRYASNGEYVIWPEGANNYWHSHENSTGSDGE